MDVESEKKHQPPPVSGLEDGVGGPEEGEILINASGHVQEMDRTFGFFSICSIGILSDNAWGAGGGSLVIS